MSNTQGMVCPNCRQSNYRKISGIIAQGTSTAEVPVVRDFDLFGEKNSFTYETTRDVTQVSNLARRLQWPSNVQPPQRPRSDLEAKVRDKTLGKTGVGYLGLAGLIGMLFGTFLPIIMSLVAELHLSFLDNHYDILVGLSCLFGIAGLPVFVYSLIKIKDLEAHPEKIPDDVARKIETNLQNAPEYQKYLVDLRKYETLNLAYQRKVEKYSRLYYCYVCDAIFDPQDSLGRVAPPEQMAAYLAIE